MPYTLTYYRQFKLNRITEYTAEHRQGKVQNWERNGYFRGWGGDVMVTYGRDRHMNTAVPGRR